MLWIEVFCAWDQGAFHIQIIIIITLIPISKETINEVKTLVSIFKALCCIEYQIFDSVCLQDPILDFNQTRIITGIKVCDFFPVLTKLLLLLQFEVILIKGDKQTF